MIEAVIFDVDGVLVDSPHEHAWGETLRRLMTTRWKHIAHLTHYAPERYTTEVYQQVVSGKPRYEGAAALLTYFGIPDPDDTRTQELCELKQQMIVELIEQGKFTAFEDGLRLVRTLRARGVKLAAASSSKNANRMLGRVSLIEDARLRLIDAFDANVCGRDFQRGKPHPEIFLTAAQLLNIAPNRCAVVEDAPAGVLAAKNGNMFCIGIARRGDAELLKAAQADVVVTSLDHVNIEELLRA